MSSPTFSPSEPAAIAMSDFAHPNERFAISYPEGFSVEPPGDDESSIVTFANYDLDRTNSLGPEDVKLDAALSVMSEESKRDESRKPFEAVNASGTYRFFEEDGPSGIALRGQALIPLPEPVTDPQTGDRFDVLFVSMMAGRDDADTRDLFRAVIETVELLS